ncbi:ShlB/FhaC/HecB family hemolysin secretion/activation protein, partial [Campylobacter volucris]|nr:ShlB/FhaC/HecB family hemolysin secretion/activation protein [Campylobacter volucris]
MKKLLFSTIVFSSLIYANESFVETSNNIEKIIELSPDRNIPQNKAIQENLKTKQEYEKMQENKKEFENKKEELKEKIEQQNKIKTE